MPFILTSTAFQHNGTIPSRYTCDGLNVSPQLSWSGVPDNTKSLVLIVDDPSPTIAHAKLSSGFQASTRLPSKSA